jgi:hypothetical protein
MNQSMKRSYNALVKLSKYIEETISAQHTSDTFTWISPGYWTRGYK